jgi:hypothetical protein
VKALYVDFDMKRVVALTIAKKISRGMAFAPFAPLRFQDVPEPQIPGPRWVKVRNARCGLCAYDAYLIACAKEQRCSMMTLDKALLQAARESGVAAIEVPQE